jgi:prepilin-type N-terminal cleavage/methylation domain-containing protein
MRTHGATSRRRANRHRGFTLIEALAAMTLLAIVMPAITQGLGVAAQAATAARHRTEATELAQQQLSELAVSGTWQGNSLSGDFSPNWPQYTWQASVQTWTGSGIGITGTNASASSGTSAASSSTGTLEEIDLRVSWLEGSGTQSIMLSTLVYPQQTATSTQ